jgi:hypothetical protein
MPSLAWLPNRSQGGFFYGHGHFARDRRKERFHDDRRTVPPGHKGLTFAGALDTDLIRKTIAQEEWLFGQDETPPGGSGSSPLLWVTTPL